MPLFSESESLGAFLGITVMNDNAFGIRGDEIDRRITQLSNQCIPFSILVPEAQFADFSGHPIFTLRGTKYVFEYAGLEPGSKIWVQIRRANFPFSRSFMRRFATSMVSVPELYQMRDGKLPHDDALRRSVAAPHLR